MATISLAPPPNFMPPRMADHFWANDNTALNNILERLLKSKRTCETILKVFEKRAQIEQDYGERLLKLSQIRLSESEEASSTFADTLQSIPTATEAAARAHIDLAQQIHHLLETPLSAFIREQKAVRKSTMAEIDKVQNLRYMHMENVKRARQAYLDECNNLKNYAGDRQGDELMQIKQKTATVDHEYKLSVGILESVTKHWVDEWKESCNTFQELEEKRLNYLSGTLLAYANMISNVYTIDDQSCDRIRGALDNLDIAADIYSFIQAKGTGSIVPDIPKYTCHHNFDEVPESTAPPTPRTVREINIPVKDEELRSVNDQLRKLPSSRPQTSESMTNHVCIFAPRTTTDHKLQEKALPSLPPETTATTKSNNENNVYAPQIQPPLDKATFQRSPATIPYPHEPVIERPTTATTLNATNQHLPTKNHNTTITTAIPTTTSPTKLRGYPSPAADLDSRISPTAPTTAGTITSPRNMGFLEQDEAQTAPLLEDGTPVLEYVKAQWSYDAKIESEITFTKNDILAVIEKKRDGWWDAQIVHSDKRLTHTRGLVPGNFMETYS
ncbi:hypothetical protein BDB00DRAFT_785100 [Zychaea mexicana]|uniref:uncharacterized protein n=1 Tax=Zychaea mexicana TaxID=64656 RepID=UPI0022FE824B|nr:uncharacterized protein BDB00DRAFT_785100 [Zychaea mexicana]KAI9496995.1 hypothetical protein BDB00DRAFT_785100 [Zychaea mexicana]